MRTPSTFEQHVSGALVALVLHRGTTDPAEALWLMSKVRRLAHKMASGNPGRKERA